MTVEQGMVVVGFIALIVSLYYNKVKSKGLRALLYIVTPLIISFVLYWGPNLKEMTPYSQYVAWQVPFIIFFYVGGIVGEVLGIVVKLSIKKLKNTKK